MISRLTLATLALAALTARAQTADTGRLTNPAGAAPAGVAKPATPAATASNEGELSLDELRDIGPVHALDKAPPHRWFEAGAGVQTFLTDNAAQREHDKTASDVETLSAHFGLNAKPVKGDAGRFDFSAGYDYAAYGYGRLSGRSGHDAGGYASKLRDLDFQAHTVKGEVAWSRGPWSAETGLRYAAYITTETGDRSYSEISPYLAGGRRFTLSQTDFIDLRADADYRFSDTPVPSVAAGFIGKDINDRFDLGLTVAYTKLLGDAWFVQPVYRYGYARYTQGTTSMNDVRADHTHLFMAAAGYMPKSWLVVRAFASWEARDSNDTAIQDYRAANLGLGASVSAKF